MFFTESITFFIYHLDLKLNSIFRNSLQVALPSMPKLNHHDKQSALLFLQSILNTYLCRCQQLQAQVSHLPQVYFSKCFWASETLLIHQAYYWNIWFLDGWVSWWGRFVSSPYVNKQANSLCLEPQQCLTIWPQLPLLKA